MHRSSLFLVALSVFFLGGAAQSKAESDTAPQVLEQRFEDWTYRCVPAPTDEDASALACELSQAVQIEQDGTPLPILNMAISKAADKAGKVDWALVVLTPLDVHLPSDFGLSFGSRKPVLSRYRNCNTLGCWVVVPASSQVVQGMKRALEGGAHFRLLDGQTVKIVYSLRGFTKGFEALRSGEPPAPQTAVSE